MVDFFNNKGGTLCKWPKNRVLFLRKSGIAFDLTANKFQDVHIEQKSRRKNICANLGPCNPIVPDSYLKNNFSERPGCDQAEIGKCQISELPGSTILPYGFMSLGFNLLENVVKFACLKLRRRISR